MSLITGALRRHEAVLEPGDVVGTDCEGSKFHSPTPLVTRQVDPLSLLSEHGEPHDTVVLCGVCTGNLRIFLRLMQVTNGALEWEVRREFGNRIRDLGMKTWKYYQEAQRA